MNQVHRVVMQAGRRLLLNEFLQAWAVCLAGALALALLARIVERVFGLGQYFGPAWKMIFVGVASVSALVALIWTLVLRRKPIQVAQEVDDRASLREALSTALYLERAKAADPWSSAVLENAGRTAVGVKVPVVVPVEAPRAWPIPLGAGLALLVAWYAVPNMDVLSINQKKVAQQQQQNEVLQVKSEVQQDKKKLEDLIAKAKVDILNEEPDGKEAPDQKPLENDPDAIRRAALKGLTDLTNKLEEAKLGEKAMQSEALKQAMQQLKQPGPGPLDQMSRALSKGDFGAAKDALDQLSKQMADNSLSQEQKDQLKQQAENLSKQLDQLAQSRQQLQKQMENAGLDKKTAEELAKKASDPESLKKAMEQFNKLTQEQKKQLMEMAKSASKSQGASSNMSEAMSKMAQGLSQSGMQQSGMEGMQQMAQELSASEMMNSDMENLNAALAEAKDQMSKLGQCLGANCDGDGQGKGGDKPGSYSTKLGQWRQGDSNKFGSGSGGPGKGNGAGPQGSPADFELEKKKADIQTTAGPTIGSRLVYGDQIKGESVAAFADAVEQGEATAAEGIDSQRIPRELEGAVKNYFGRLKDKANESAGKGTTPPPAPTAKDAAEPKKP